MATWEYKVVKAQSDNMLPLNTEGGTEWELVAVISPSPLECEPWNYRFYFKRLIKK